MASNHSFVNKDEVWQWIDTQPVCFLENKGQMTDGNGKPIPFVFFKAQAPGINMYITDKGITYFFLEKNKETGFINNDSPLLLKENNRDVMEWSRIDVHLQGAVIKKENIIREGLSMDFSKYYSAHCPKGITDVHSCEKITIKNIYPGIDWVFYNTNNKGLKYDFIVHPGADYKQIEMLYKSKSPININDGGEIELYTQHGNLKENTPVSFSEEKKIETRFKQNYQRAIEINGDKGYETSISFDVDSKFNPGYSGLNSTLIIDPQLVWGTFYGGSGAEAPMSIDTDGSGNVFVTGYVANSADFPVQDAGTFFQGTSGSPSSYDAFIMKFDNSGTLLWSTFYGGSGDDYGYSIATDGNGNVFVTGTTTSNNFPLQNSGTFFKGTNGADDIFILKFDNSGNRLWATYYGGTNSDFGYSIVCDANDNVFLTGYTISTDFPVQDAGTFFQGSGGGNFNDDAFILKFDNVGNRLWATYYGLSGGDYGNSIAIDGNGNVLITGYTYSATFPVQDASTFFQGNLTGGIGAAADAFILKFDNLGNRLWATYYGGSLDDRGLTVNADASGNVFVTGYTQSTNFPVQNAGTFFQGTNGGQTDAFILKFDNSGNRLWATYYGGSQIDHYYASSYDNMVIDNCGNIYMSFETSSGNLPVKNSCDAGYFDNSLSGVQDQAIVLFSNDGTRLWATYVGGNGSDYRSPLAIDRKNNLFMTGEWTSVTNPATYPLVNPGGTAYYATFNASADGFIVKFSSKLATGTITAISTCNMVCTGSATVNVNGICNYNYLWSNGQTTQTAIDLCADTYTITSTDCISNYTGTVTIGINGTITADAGNDVTITAGNSTILSATGGTIYQWSPAVGLSCVDCPNPTANPLSTTYYCVTVSDSNGCKDSACLTVSVDIYCEPFISDAFSPNGDDQNDVECIYGVSCMSMSFKIYDRWGEVVFETNEPNGCWNGRYKGKLMDTGVFYYTLEGTYINGETIFKKGTVTLIR